MKKGKELGVNSLPNYSVYSGTIDNKKSKSIYVNISSWGKPTSDSELNYEKVIRSIRRKILLHTHEILRESNFKVDNTIVDLDMRSSGVNFNKKSFMSCDITLFQKVFHPINSELTMDSVKNISDSIISNVLEGNQYFEFTRKK